MLLDRPQPADQHTGRGLKQSKYLRLLSIFLAVILALTQIPVVSAHGSVENSGPS